MDLYFHEESIKARRLKYKNKFQPSNYPPLMLDCCCWCQIEFRSPGIFYKMWFSLPQTWVIFSHLFTFATQKIVEWKIDRKNVDIYRSIDKLTNEGWDKALLPVSSFGAPVTQELASLLCIQLTLGVQFGRHHQNLWNIDTC